LFDLVEPEDVVPAWKRWSPILLRPEGLYGTRPAAYSGVIRPVIPITSGHPYRFDPAGDSGASGHPVFA